MKRFKNILYVADRPLPSPTFDRALELAQANQAQLTVMDVVEPMIWSAENQARFGTDLTNILRDRRQQELIALTEPHDQADPQNTPLIRTQVAVGTPFLEIIRATLRNRFDLVIKSAERPQGFLRSTLGPNDQHLVRKCPCPVWIDREDRGRPYRKILAAVDPLGEQDVGLARTVMDLATSFSAWEGSEIHVAHAWRLPGETTLQGGRFRVPDIDLQQMLQEQENRHARALGELLGDYNLSVADQRVHFVKDTATALITRLAQQLPADLIVMGTVGRTGIPGFFIGNTAEAVLQVTDLPVLTVKPTDFVSPVTTG